MVKHYIDAANKIMNLANQCEDVGLANILKNGSLKIVQLAKNNGAILKAAAIELPEEKVETIKTAE